MVTELTSKQGFNSAYYLEEKAAALTKSTGQTWTAAQVEVAFAEAGLTPSQHYLLYGYDEGLAPNAYFNKTEYIASKAAAQGETPAQFLSAWKAASGSNNVFLHYIQYGSFEDNVNPSSGFNDQEYYEAKAKLLGAGWTWEQVREAIKDAGLNAISHYQLYGKAEGVPYTPTPIPVDGETYTLTAGADHILGGEGNNTVNGVVSGGGGSATTTLSAIDTINGGVGGSNLLSIITDGVVVGDVLNGALISNIQTVNIRNTTAGSTDNIDASTFAGLAAVNAYRGSGNVAVTNLDTGASAGIIGDGSTTEGSLAFGYATANDAATLNLSGGVKAGGVTITSAPKSATVNSAGATNSIASLNIGASATALTVNADTNLNIAGGITGAALKKETISGKASQVVLGASPASVTTIDASGLTVGGVVVTTGAALTSFTGGGGADIVNLGATTPKATISLGAGNDTLMGTAVLPNAAVADGGAGTDTFSVALVSSGNAENIKNFEVMDITGYNKSLDISLLKNSDISSLVFSGTTAYTANTATIQNVDAAATVDVTGLLAGAGTLGNLTLTQTANPSLTVNFNANAGTAGGNSMLGTLTQTGNTAITINAGGNSNVTADGITAIEDTGNTLTQVTITGGTDFSLFGITTATENTSGTAVASSLTLIDGSAATGKLTIAAGFDSGRAVTYTGLTINGGVGDDTIAINAKNGIVNGGAGDDMVWVGPNSSSVTRSNIVTVNGGAGADTLVTSLIYNRTADASSAWTDGNFVKFDATSGDILMYANVANASGTLGAKVDTSAATTFDQAVYRATIAAGATAQTVVWFQYGGDTYMSNNGALVNDTTDDLITKFDGLVDLSSSVVNSGVNGTITFA